MSGAGPRWVLLRGLGRERGHWGDFADRLRLQAGAAEVLTPDLPGTGRRRGETSPTRVPDLVAACRGELAAAGVRGPLHLLGLSLGGMVALQWALAHPQEVAAVTVVNTSARGLGSPAQRLRPGVRGPLLATLWARDAQAAEAAVLRCTSADAARQQAVLPAWTALRQQRPVSRGTVLRQLWAAARWTPPPRWTGPPLQLLASAGDRLVDPACSERLAARWGVPLRRHPWAGHDLPLDDPEWVLAQLA